MSLVRPDHGETKVTKEHVDQKEKKERQVQLVHQGQKLANLVLLAEMDLLVNQVKEVPTVCRVKEVLPDQKVKRVTLEILELLACPDRLAYLENRDELVHLANRDRKEIWVLQVSRVRVAHRELMVNPVAMEILVNLVFLEKVYVAQPVPLAYQVQSE